MTKITEERRLKLEEKAKLEEEKRLQTQKLLDASKSIESENNVFTFLFNNSVMAKILDLLFDNPKIPIYTSDFAEKTDISRKSLYSNLLILTTFGIVEEITVGKRKFYVLNPKNPITKHISKLIDIIHIENAKIQKDTR